MSSITQPQHGQGRTKATLYTIGFILCLILTLIPYFSVSQHWFSVQATFGLISAFAVIQALVQAFCFVRSNTHKEDGQWNVIAFVFTLIVMTILVGGSLWVMYNINYHMGMGA